MLRSVRVADPRLLYEAAGFCLVEGGGGLHE
jgi:hypothetical protein